MRPDPRRIEQHRVRHRALAQHAAIGQAQDRRRQAGGLAHRLLQRHQAVAHREVLDPLGERARPARMAAAGRAVAGDRHVRIEHQPRLQRLVHHEMRRHAAARPDPEQHVRERLAGLLGHLRQRLAHVRPGAEQQRAGPAAADHARLQRRAQLVTARGQHFGVVGRRHRPLGEQDAHAGVAGGVGIDVGGQLDAGAAVLLQRLQQPFGAAGAFAVHHLQVRNVGARRPAGLHVLADRLLDPVVILRAHMAHRHPAKARHRLPERRDLHRLRVHPGHVLQAGGGPERTGRQVFLQQPDHASDLHLRGLAGAIVDAGLPAQRAVAGAGGDVDVRTRAIHRVHPLRQPPRAVFSRARAATVLAQHHGGHAHREELLVGALQRITMGMQVDEARRQHPAAALDDTRAARGAAADPADLRDPPAGDQHVGVPGRRAGAVDHHHVADLQHPGLCLSPARHRRQHRRRRARRHHRQHLAPGPARLRHPQPLIKSVPECTTPLPLVGARHAREAA